MTKREWTDDMGEISGFGGGYEDACRAMLLAGLDWLDENPEVNPQHHGFKGVYGLTVSDNIDGENLEKAMAAASAEGCTGAMMQACLSHVYWVQAHSWDEYCAELRKAEKKRQSEVPND